MRIQFTSLSLIFLCLFAYTICDVTLAQKDDGPVGIFNSQTEYHEFMGGVKQAAYGEGGSPELQAMVPLLNDIALNKPVGWTASEYGTESSTLGMLADADVRSELEMVDDQYQQLKDLNATIQKRAAEQIRQLDFSDREDLVAKINSIRESAIEDLNGVLLPHQIERLKQIRMQSLVKRKSFIEVLTTNPLKTKLELSDDQCRDLRLNEKKISEELEREIAKLRERAREKLLSSLTSTQQAEIKELFGEAFEFKAKAKRKSKSTK